MDSSQALLVGLAFALFIAIAFGGKREPVQTSEPGFSAPIPDPTPVAPEPVTVAPAPVSREITLSAKYEEKLRQILKAGGWKGPGCQLPALPPFFTARRGELARLLARLDGDDPPRALAITAARGLAGVGRTAFATTLAHVVAERFPDAQLFLDLRGDESEGVAEVMRHVLLSLNPAAPLPRNANEIPQSYRRALEGRRVLLWIANVFPQPYLELLLPPAGSLLLFTAREALVLSNIETVALEPFSRPDARAFLGASSTRMKREGDAHLDLLGELSGQLPAALRLNAARLHGHPALHIDEQFDALKKADGLRQPLDAAVRTTFEGMPLPLQHSWRQLAAIADSFDDDDAAAICELSGETMREQLEVLTSAGMLRVVAHGATMRFDVHEFARAFAAQLPEQNAAGPNLRFAGHCATLTDAARRQSVERAWKWTRAFVQRFQTHAADEVALTDLPEPFAAPARVPDPLYPDALRVLMDFSNAGTRTGNLAWLEAAVSATRALRYRAGEGRTLANLGRVRAQSGEARLAVACFEEWVAITRETGDRREEASALGWLGTGWKDAGFPDRGAGCFEAQLSIAREIGDRTGEARALEKLGQAKASLGDFPNAAATHDEQLRLAREIGDAENEASALENLGVVWMRLNDLGKAADFHREQLRTTRAMCDRAGESRALGHLGHTELLRGEIDAALAHYEEQLKLAQDAADFPGESQVHGSLGVAWARQGDLRRAIAHYGQQLRIAHETGNRLAEATAHANIGTALERLGDLAGTAASWEKALAIYEALGSPSAESIRRRLERVRKAGAVS